MRYTNALKCGTVMEEQKDEWVLLQNPMSSNPKVPAAMAGLAQRAKTKKHACFLFHRMAPDLSSPAANWTYRRHWSRRAFV